MQIQTFPYLGTTMLCVDAIVSWQLLANISHMSRQTRPYRSYFARTTSVARTSYIAKTTAVARTSYSAKTIDYSRTSWYPLNAGTTFREDRCCLSHSLVTLNAGNLLVTLNAGTAVLRQGHLSVYCTRRTVSMRSTEILSDV